MITVACVLRAGPEYDAEYVERLANGVAEHLSLEHRFVCLSDVPVPCERIPLETEWPGWLAKLELFRPGLFDGPVIYFDLDTVICGSLDEIAAYPHRFSMLVDFFHPERHLASGMMAWNGDYSRVFTAFSDELVPHYRDFNPHGGDGGWIVSQLDEPAEPLQDIFPGQIASYKLGREPDMRVVCFHGPPRPREVGWSLARMGSHSRMRSRYQERIA